MDRRDFIKRCLWGGAALAGARLLTGREVIDSALAAKKTPEKKPTVEVVKESDPMAQTLFYHENANKVDPKKWPKRAGADGKKQFCDSCQFYTKSDAKTGACQIFQGKLVQAKGWCNTWTKKA